MISERLRLMFAAERRPLLIRSLVFGIALLLIPPVRIGLVDLFLVSLMVPSPAGSAMVLALWLWLLLFSLPLIPLFLVWSLPGVGRLGLPKRSIGALSLLIAYQPFRFYLDGRFYGAETLAMVARIHEQFPIVWAFKHLDTPSLLGLVVWTMLRRQTARPAEKVWFHWLLFGCALWAAGAFYDFYLGHSLPVDLRDPAN
ncbi:MAG: hypothetical protein IID48_08025 [Proteobacteria bacterium]|nr:hypothetical protein [Pseudomonadota bacterium]